MIRVYTGVLSFYFLQLPRRNSDPYDIIDTSQIRSHLRRRHLSPLTPRRCVPIVVLESRIQHFLASSTRVELLLPVRRTRVNTGIICRRFWRRFSVRYNNRTRLICVKSRPSSCNQVLRKTRKNNTRYTTAVRACTPCW